MKFRGDVGPTYVTITPDNLQRTVSEFVEAKASRGPRQTGEKPGEARKSKKAKKKRSSGLPPGVIAAKDEGLDHVADAALRAHFPIYYPTARIAKGRYVDKPRMYDLFDRSHRKYRAYRIVTAEGDQGQYYGVQGTSWKDPPILEPSQREAAARGRTYELFFDGGRLRLVAWRTERGVYWVSNTLSRSSRTARCSPSRGRSSAWVARVPPL